MAHRSKTAAFLLVGLLMFMPFTPVVSADGGTQTPASYAFLPSWSGAISGDLDQTGDSTTHQFTNHDFDDEGNMYYVVGDDYGNWMDNQYQISNERGFHLLKIDSNGVVEYTEKVTCSNYCNNPDYYYTKVVGVHVIDEDQLYLTLSAYNTYLDFAGTQYYTSSHNLVTAFYNNGSWDWVDQEQTNGYAYNSLAYQGLGEDGTLYTVLMGAAASGYLDYSITSASMTGANWVRMLEIPYEAPTYNYMTP